MVRAPDEAMQFLWATCKKDGKPHARDSWELELKRDDKVKVIKDMGNDWFVVLNGKEMKGWAHGSWLDFENRKVRADAREAYTRFQEDVRTALVPGQLRDFPAMASYMDVCTKVECQPLKEEVSLLGICVHDLLALLQGSGKVSYEWLKEKRNVWHPDRFARFCLAECSERLKPMAEKMFVMYGVLMDACNG
jgi:methylenetetrahydrofolate dehydrogenase (NADP+)/methenyltetrahydrofolate cyclohydrolase/formyltetrahydrofolate synthetase